MSRQNLPKELQELTSSSTAVDALEAIKEIAQRSMKGHRQTASYLKTAKQHYPRYEELGSVKTLAKMTGVIQQALWSIKPKTARDEEVAVEPEVEVDF